MNFEIKTEMNEPIRVKVYDKKVNMTGSTAKIAKLSHEQLNLGKKFSVPIVSEKPQIMIYIDFLERFDIGRQNDWLLILIYITVRSDNFSAGYGSINRHLPSHTATINLAVNDNLV